MKKLLSVILVVLMLSTSVICASAASVDLSDEGKTIITVGDWVYEAIDGGSHLSVDQYIGSNTDLVVPRIVNDKMVVSIGSHCFLDNNSVISVETSSPLQKVGDYAFLNCTSLESFECSFALKEIAVGAFSGTTALRTINLEDSEITVVSPHAFMNSGIVQAKLPDTCTEIQHSAFSQCPNLTMLMIPRSVTVIDDAAFTRSDNLTIYCYRDSYAHSFAVEHEIPYVLLDDLYESISFTTHSISLNGDIVLNYYLFIPDEYVNTGKATVDFSWTVNNENKTHSVTLSSTDKYSSGYKAACPLPIAEMTYGVTAVVSIDGVVRSLPDTYSVRNYANVILSNDSFATKYIQSENDRGKNGSERLNQLRTLVKTMLDYGSKAQIRFDRDTDNLANGGTDFFSGEVTIPSGASNMDEYLSDCGLEYYGTSVVYLSQTTLRHYYRIVESSKFTAEIKNGITFDGAPVTYGTRNGLIYFDKKNIAASQLDTEYVLNINGHGYQYSALDYSALSYSLDSSSYDSSIAKQLAASVYRYNQAANVYFND